MNKNNFNDRNRGPNNNNFSNNGQGGKRKNEHNNLNDNKKGRFINNNFNNDNSGSTFQNASAYPMPQQTQSQQLQQDFSQDFYAPQWS
jgi:hypothetical protein